MRNSMILAGMFAAVISVPAAQARSPAEAYRECIESRIAKYRSASIEIRSLAEAIYGSCSGEAERAFMVEQNEPMVGGKRAVLAERPWDAEMESRRSIEIDREIYWIMGRLLLSR